ncbi:ABC transporter permease [uncultured Robinsoniella sp.]|uniref:ABC transporter permease n=1 Tax=uncultured Robinsoniella sp. TaxID=904190 RepID=UPI00374FD0C3
MNGLKYQLKNISKDKMCMLSFILPVIVGIAIHFISAGSFNAISETSYGIIQNELPQATAEWLKESGNVIRFGSIEELKAQVLEPSSQMIGVRPEGNGIWTIVAGDELRVTVKIADSLPDLYENRSSFSDINVQVLLGDSERNMLKSLLIVITMVTAMFMGCTFNAMSIIGEKEEGVAFINEILPVTPAYYLVQKILLGFAGGVLSTILTGWICMRPQLSQIPWLLLLIVLSAFISALTGLFIGRAAEGLMTGIVYLKMIMILFIAPPVVCYLVAPKEGIVRSISYLLPSSATFYGLMDLLNGRMAEAGANIVILAMHCVVWILAYLFIQRRKGAQFPVKG